MSYTKFASYLVAIAATLFVLFLPYIFFDKEVGHDGGHVRVLTYSSFIEKWGAGPQIEKLFFAKTGLKIQWINSGNAGLILERLKFKGKVDQPDLVIGLDQFSVFEAEKEFDWVALDEVNASVKNSLLPEGARMVDFLAYDWGPLSFVYRDGEVTPPESLQDLLKEEYKGQLILQDPRMSSPGLQFFFWVLSAFGEEQGFEYLKKLKPSIKMMSPSWSSSYSIFKVEQPTIVFSYKTSPLFHLIEEGDSSYRAAQFDVPHPIQVEYAGIPKFCKNCGGAYKLAQFLLEPEVQKQIMTKNFMLPVVPEALQGSSFVVPKNGKYFKPIENMTLIQKKPELINRWKKIFY